MVESHKGGKIEDWDIGKGPKELSAVADTTTKNRYELINTLAVWHTSEMHEIVGLMLKDLATSQTIGYSFREAWRLIKEHGSTNIIADGEQRGILTIRMLTTKNGLASLDDPQWAISVLTEQDQPHTVYSKCLIQNIPKRIKAARLSRFSNVMRKREIVDTKKVKVMEENNEQIINYKKLSDYIKKAKKIVVLSGAGMSTESLIPDFRSSKESIWMRDKLLLSQKTNYQLTTSQEDFWNSFKELLYLVLDDFLPIKSNNTLLESIRYFEPNVGHQFFAELEQQGKEILIITQNVDGLHTKAGNSKIIELHGNINKVVCPVCQKQYDLDTVIQEDVPRCINKVGNKFCQAILRPDMVLFGDLVNNFEEAVEEVKKYTDLLIVAGTSLEVSPANKLPCLAKEHGINTVMINKEETQFDSLFDLVIKEEIGKTVKQVKSFLRD
ncbi:hypothetical protein JCM14036_25170 [Desulfotomaculum defluvii]